MLTGLKKAIEVAEVSLAKSTLQYSLIPQNRNKTNSARSPSYLATQKINGHQLCKASQGIFRRERSYRGAILTGSVFHSCHITVIHMICLQVLSVSVSSGSQYFQCRLTSYHPTINHSMYSTSMATVDDS